jgi:hypothetical protein
MTTQTNNLSKKVKNECNLLIFLNHLSGFFSYHYPHHVFERKKSYAIDREGTKHRYSQSLEKGSVALLPVLLPCTMKDASVPEVLQILRLYHSLQVVDGVGQQPRVGPRESACQEGTHDGCFR